MLYSYNGLWKKLIDLNMTKTEMRKLAGISTNILAKLGKEKGEEEIERIAASNPALNDLEQTNVIELDRTEAIRNLIDFIACEFGLSIDSDL